MTSMGTLFLEENEIPGSFNDTAGDSVFLQLAPGNGFLHAFVVSTSVIVVSELGDKTFFIAMILAMNHSRLAVFAGAITALVLMTILSAFLGLVSAIIPRIYVHWIVVSLFIIFGLKMIKDGYCMKNTEVQEEYHEAQKAIDSRDFKYAKNSEVSVEAGTKAKQHSLKLVWVFVEAFIMTFLAEWGDRSQITTIVIAARQDTVGVVMGASFGHAVCTILAVFGGRIVAEKLSVRAVTIIGGFIFIVFALSSIYSGPDSDTMLGVANDISFGPKSS